MRLLTYNILQGGRGREELILEVLRLQHADLIVLQELADPALLEYLATELGMHAFFAPANRQLIKQDGGLRWAGRNLGLLSRFPIVSARSYRAFPVRRALLEAVVEYAPGQQLAVYGVHLRADLAVLAELGRRWEVAAILKRLGQRPVESCLVAGDFNALAPGDFFDRAAFPGWLKIGLALQFGRVYRWAIPALLKAELVDCYRHLYPAEPGLTLPTGHPTVRLDYIFASPNLAALLQDCQVITDPPTDRASDHHPLLGIFDF